MVQNLIDQVRKAENEAEAIVLNAEKTREKLIKKAETDADEFRKSIEAAARKKGVELLEEKKKECEASDRLKDDETEKEIVKILAAASEKEVKVVGEIIKYLFD